MNDLIKIDAELALPVELVEKATEYIREAKSERTREAYAVAWRFFTEWCGVHGRCALPCSPETLAAWIVALAEGQDGRKPRARATISHYVAGVVAAQRAAGHEFNRQHAVLKSTLAGVNRVKAQTETVRKAAPLLGTDLHSLLKGLRPDVPADARDGALLALGWSGALRRSEIVALDWQQLGTGRGFVRVDERGVEVVLMRSKASQDAAVTIVVPIVDMPSAASWLQAWAQVANLQPGDPIFRFVDNRKRIAAERLHKASVSRIVKARLRRFVLARGATKEAADEIVRRFSGHSMRAGFATSAADADVPLSRLASHTRHKSLETLQGYVRSSEQWRKSPLKGLGF
jgi:integrase